MRNSTTASLRREEGQNVKIGLCASIDRATEVRALGFDYLEVNAVEIGQMTEEAFARKATEAKSTGLPILSANCLFPKDLNLYGEQDRVAAWLQLVMARLAALGVKTVVFGSGAARRRPDSLPYDAAFRSLVRTVRLTGDCAKAFGMMVTMEPLHFPESNMINSLAEGAALSAAAEHPNVSLLADTYHMAMAGEDPREIVRVGGVRHVHAALLEGRRWPVTTDAFLTRFMAALRESGYHGLVSIEGNSENWQADAPGCLRTLRALWEGEA